MIDSRVYLHFGSAPPPSFAESIDVACWRAFGVVSLPVRKICEATVIVRSSVRSTSLASLLNYLYRLDKVL